MHKVRACHEVLTSATRRTPLVSAAGWTRLSGTTGGEAVARVLGVRLVSDLNGGLR
jgi:hypothetical protein